jgi:hypothetical protein
MMLCDDPAFISEMVEFWTEYIAELLRIAFEYIVPDCVHISEDMAYKDFSMVSPTSCR